MGQDRTKLVKVEELARELEVAHKIRPNKVMRARICAHGLTELVRSGKPLPRGGYFRFGSGAVEREEGGQIVHLLRSRSQPF